MKKKSIPVILILACCAIGLIIAFSQSKNTTKKNSGKTEDTSSQTTDDTEVSNSDFELSLAFAGDISASPNHPLDFTLSFTSEATDADFAWAQNENTYSDVEAPSKYYTTGFDILGLANESFTNDELLDISAEMLNYAGAGYSKNEASTPVYLTSEDITVAYVCACDVKDSDSIPEASENTPGVFTATDKELLLNNIKEANEIADYVIFLPHWGEKAQTEVSSEQTSLAHDCLDAGADIVIGTHPDNILGMEVYNEKPIIYSLGSLNPDIAGKSILVSIGLSGNKEESGGGTSVEIKEASLRIVPTVADDKGIRTAESEERPQIIDSFVNTSNTAITVSDDGIIGY